MLQEEAVDEIYWVRKDPNLSYIRIDGNILKTSKLVRSCYSFYMHNLQEATFVCTIAIDNFCLHYYIWQLSYALLQMSTFYALLQLPTFFMEYCNWKLLYGRLYALLYFSFIDNVSMYVCMYQKKLYVKLRGRGMSLSSLEGGLIWVKDREP